MEKVTVTKAQPTSYVKWTAPVEIRVCASVEDKRALEVMETTLKMIDRHYKVALPWRYDPP